MESTTLVSSLELRSDRLLSSHTQYWPGTSRAISFSVIFLNFVQKNLLLKKKSVPLQSNSKKLVLRHGFGPRIDSLAQ